MNDTALNVWTEIESIDSLLNRGMMCEAHDLSQQAKELFPDNVRILQLYAQALAGLGATDKARACPEPLFRGKKGSAKTYVIRRKNEVQ